MRLVSPNMSDLLEPNIEIGKFPDGDTHIRIPDLAQVAGGSEVTVFHRLWPKQNNALVELLLILDALREEGAKITAVVPYLPYARQDKKKLTGEVASAHVLCRLLQRAGVSRLVTFDCHFLTDVGETEYQGLPISNLSMNEELIQAATEFFAGEPFDLVSPDLGSNYLVKDHGGTSMNKTRKDYDQGKIGYRDIEHMEGLPEVAQRNVLLLDDMISTGNTMIKACDLLQRAGAKQICVAATHGLFLYNCLDKLRKVSDRVFSSDTIPSPQAEVSIKPKLGAL